MAPEGPKQILYKLLYLCAAFHFLKYLKRRAPLHFAGTDQPIQCTVLIPAVLEAERVLEALNDGERQALP